MWGLEGWRLAILWRRLTLDCQALSERAILWRVERPLVVGDCEVAGATIVAAFCSPPIGGRRLRDWCRMTKTKNVKATQNHIPHTERILVRLRARLRRGTFAPCTIRTPMLKGFVLE